MSSNSISRSPSPTSEQNAPLVGDKKPGILAKMKGLATNTGGRVSSQPTDNLRATASTSHAANIQTPLTTASSIQQLHDSVKDPNNRKDITLFTDQINTIFTNLISIGNPHNRLEHYQAAQHTIQALQQHRQENGQNDLLEMQLGVFAGTIGEKVKTVQQILAKETDSHPREAEAASSQATSESELQTAVKPEGGSKLNRKNATRTNPLQPKIKASDQQPATTPTAAGVDKSQGFFDQISEV